MSRWDRDEMTHSKGMISRRSALAAMATSGAATAGLAGGAHAGGKFRAPVTPFGKLTVIPGGARLVQGEHLVDILFTTSGAASVVKYPAAASLDTAGFFLTPDALAKDVSLAGSSLRHGEVEVRIDKAAGTLTFLRAGKIVLTDTGTQGLTTFRLARESDLYGLGQFRDAMPNYRDKTIYLAQANMDSCNPFLVSPDGFGLLWDSHTDSHLTSAGRSLTYSNGAPLTRYHVCLDPDLDAVIATYRQLTGTAPLLGKYAYGFWQSQERYHSQAEVTGMVDAYRQRNLPLDVIVQDWRYWGDDALFSGMVWDKVNFADPKAMCDHVHGQNAHIIASVWPAFGPASDIYKALDAEKLLFAGPHWGGGKVLDITSPRARDIYWSHIDDGLMSVGLDGLWTDGCEPEFMSTGSRYVTARSYAENGDCFAGPIKDNLLTFSYYQTRLIYQSMRRDHPTKRPLTLSRKVYAGQQAFNAVTWSGDQFASWQTLNYQITAAQQFSLSGVPYWTDDIGGFLVSHRFPAKLDDPAYRELYVRWFQFGAFMPVFRAHGTEIPREIFAFGADGDPHYEALKIALKRRYALMPYIYSQAARVTFDHETFLRPLVMDFRHDPKIAGHGNQYMFGHDILVTVVNTPLDAVQDNLYEFIPNYAVTGLDGPAPEVTFFEGANFEKLVDTRHSDDLKMSWSGDIPYSLKGKPYSARWKGKIIAQESGSHAFQIMTQGLVKFTVDGVVRVASAGTDEGKANGANGGVSFAGHNGDDTYRFDMTLKAGQAYSFELTQSQPTPDVVSLWVEWIRPSRKADLQVSPDKTIDVYLPAGHDWYKLDGGPRLSGGQTLKLRPAIADMPLYARAGAIIPMVTDIQYANSRDYGMMLHIYAGADGAFTMYDDAGDGHDYETGAFRRYPMTWHDATSTLTLGPVTGTYGVDASQGLDIVVQPFTVTVHAPDGSRRTQSVNTVPSQQKTVVI